MGFVLISAGIACAQTPNFSQNIASILYAHCTTCHRPGSIAPFSLITYQDAVLHHPEMQTDVNSGKMPPWPPDASYRHLAHERMLSAAEKQTINDWINGGWPQGDSTLTPAVPTFPTGSTLGTPDQVVTCPTYTVPTTTDIYRCFVIPSGQSVQKWLTALEVIPGNRGIVHHALVYYDTTGTCAALDAADPAPGYTSFGGVGSNSATLLGGWVPGTTSAFLPTGMGIRVPPNGDFVIQIHYPAGTQGESDSTKINFFYSSLSSPRQVWLNPILNHLMDMTNGPLVIPANTVQTFDEEYQLPTFPDVSVIEVAPHMHLLGKTIKSYAVTPVNDTIPFIKINNWDFHWQGFYMFRNILKVPAHSVLRATATYDNTINNLNNPNSPPQTVTAGEATTDEMMIVYYAYTYYLPGDENIVIDSTSLAGVDDIKSDDIVKTPQLYEPAPNPASASSSISFYLPEESSVQLIITDISGKESNILLTENKMGSGFHVENISTEKFAAGSYIITLKTASSLKCKKLLVVK